MFWKGGGMFYREAPAEHVAAVVFADRKTHHRIDLLKLKRVTAVRQLLRSMNRAGWKFWNSSRM